MPRLEFGPFLSRTQIRNIITYRIRNPNLIKNHMSPSLGQKHKTSMMAVSVIGKNLVDRIGFILVANV